MDYTVDRCIDSKLHCSNYHCLSFSRCSSAGVLVFNCNAWIPPSRLISSFNEAYTIRCRAGCIFDSKASEVIVTLIQN